jgi:hypothetical protein
MNASTSATPPASNADTAAQLTTGPLLTVAKF